MNSSATHGYTGLEVAVIGMACRFPGADDWRSFWANLENGIESVQMLEEPPVSPKRPGRENFVAARVLLQNKELFDADFFNYRPDEAALMNPQHRIFHECVWEALEDAGCDPDNTRGLIGLYAAGSENLNWKLYSILKNNQVTIDDYTLDYLNSRDYLASMVAYKLNLKGGVAMVNTACSSTLVAINMAYKSLLLGENDVALAGGISLVTQPQDGYFFEDGMIASRDGHCRAFDKSSSGTVRGEGAGMIVLKRLADARKDGDHIYAVIKGSAINNDGRQKVGFTAPAIQGQVECIKRAHLFAKVLPETISYVEAHGTATKLGDLIEIEALNLAFNHNISHRCAIGSVKTNLGHLDTAAGVAGFIKTVLSLKNKKIAASLHFTEANPELPFDKGPFFVNAALTNWPAIGGSLRRAGVSSFGIGGTNAHLILEEAPSRVPVVDDTQHYLVMFSARSPQALKNYEKKLLDFLAGEDQIDLNNLCYTLREGRRQFEFRKSLAICSRSELLAALSSAPVKQHLPQPPVNAEQSVFLIPGQGSQYVNMARGIYERNNSFKVIVDEGLQILSQLASEDFKKILFPDSGEDDRIHDTRFTQPLLFLVEYALCKLLIVSGILPDYLIGHSVGEYVAATISGVFSFPDALKVINHRAVLLQRVTGGAMIGAAIDEDNAFAYLNEKISIAAINQKAQVVFSGRTEEMEELERSLRKNAIAYTRLNTEHAFHSSMLDPLLENFKTIFEGLTLSAPVIPFISNLSGKIATELEVITPDYWTRHMRHTVRFDQGVDTLMNLCSNPRFIETGPGKILSDLVSGRQIAGKPCKPVNLLINSNQPGEELGYFTAQIGKLWETGLNPDWSKILQIKAGLKISLPTYAFDRRPYPAEVPSVAEMIRAGDRISSPADTPSSSNKGIYYASWKRSFTKRNAQKAKTILFFSSNSDFTTDLVRELTDKGHFSIEIVVGDRYSKISPSKYALRPGVPADYQHLIEDFQECGTYCTDILYNWTVLTKMTPELLGNSGQLDLLYFGIIHSIKSLSGYMKLSDINFVLLTNSLYLVHGTEKSQYQQSLALGLLPCLKIEYEMSCYHIDILQREHYPSLACDVATEVLGLDSQEPCVAVRNGKRWVQIFEQTVEAESVGDNGIKKGGIYLITGGLGNAGFTIAKHLLINYGVRLILMGRQAETGTKNAAPLTEKSQRLLELKQLSTNVFYSRTDICDVSALTLAVESLEKEHGPINGVIHAAGITDAQYFDFIDAMSAPNAITLLAPKVQGIENMFKVFSKRGLDFFWTTSSISAITGGMGHAAYAAANAYVNFFIVAKSPHVYNWLSVALSELVFTKQEMKRMPRALGPSELTAVFEYTLQLRTDAVLYQSKTNLRLQANVSRRSADPSPYENTGSEVHHQPLMQKKTGAEFEAPATPTETNLAKIFEGFFGFEKISIHDNFFELGGDSLKGMVLLKRINAAFQVNLQLADFLKNPDLFTLAQKIDEMSWLGSDDATKYEFLI